MPGVNEMNKKQRIAWIYAAIKSSGKDYEVLSDSSWGPQHIRVSGVGDIWPSTGTYSVKGKFKKRQPEKFIEMCGGNAEVEKRKSKYEELEERVGKIEEYCSFIESELSYLKFKREIAGGCNDK